MQIKLWYLTFSKKLYRKNKSIKRIVYQLEGEEEETKKKKSSLFQINALSVMLYACNKLKNSALFRPADARGIFITKMKTPRVKMKPWPLKPHTPVLSKQPAPHVLFKSAAEYKILYSNRFCMKIFNNG